ncbi:MAG: hypothetical protein IJH09_04275 [Clostridia bacterium]|nr:hypothetical protein [Clostridia bacterium]
MILSLEGPWRAELPGQHGTAYLPGTLDESGLGHADAVGRDPNPASDGTAPPAASGPIATRLTRRHTFEGEARLTRTVDVVPPEGCRVFFEVERARCLRVFVDGREVLPYEASTLSAPQVFEVTGMIRRGAELTLRSDNSYPGLPREDILYASAATDETQTNWNGAIGYVRLRPEAPVFIAAVRALPRGDRLDVTAEIDAAGPYRGVLRVSCEALTGDAVKNLDLPAGRHAVRLEGLPLTKGVRRWDEGEGNLYALTAALEGFEAKHIRFGIRDFGDDGTGRLALNGRRLFLRGEANCAVFPETGHPPMTASEWKQILETYRACGVNTVRFHSWCPPEAAFEAADALGMLAQPELSHWNPRDALENDAAWEYYSAELRAILRAYANHPSFVMLTLGNELATGERGHARMTELLDLARSIDPTRLYANGSNVHYGERGCDPASDFYTSFGWRGLLLRGTMAGDARTGGALTGHINEAYPSARTDYSAAMSKLREEYGKPVFSFEVGQYEVLPDFGELSDFKGVTDPANLRLVRDRVERMGLLDAWDDCVRATGELSLLCYREEVEAALRTPELSGLSLLGLQDFPGQGTALVGVLNSHLRPKPLDFAAPERFRAFFRDQLPMALLEKYAWESTETLRTRVLVANYGKGPVSGPMRWRLEGGGFAEAGTLSGGPWPTGGLAQAGVIEASLSAIDRPTRLELTLEAGETRNRYPLWVYPPVVPRCPEGVAVADTFESARAALEAGARVFLDPPMEAPLNAVPTHFSTDFWSVGTFPYQSGAMGQLIDAAHPLFRAFPTRAYTEWQWWPMASRRAALLPWPMRAIVAQLDSFAKLRPMAQLFECRAGKGRLLFSGFALRGLQQYPEARALLDAIYGYMASGDFAPEQEMTMEELARLFDA